MKTALIVMSLLSVFAVDKACSDDKTNALSARWAVAYGTGMANVSRMALSTLYEGKTNEAIQILEANLDHAVCQMDGLLSKETNYTQVLKSALTSIALYRTIHERPKVTLVGSEEDQVILDEIAQKAQQILEGYRRHDSIWPQNNEKAVRDQTNRCVGLISQQATNSAGSRVSTSDK